MVVRGRKKQDTREKCIMRSFIICTSYQIFRKRLAEHVACTGERRGRYRVLVEKPKRASGGRLWICQLTFWSNKRRKHLFIFRKNVILWFQAQLRLTLDRHEQNDTSNFNVELRYETSQKHGDRLTQLHLWELLLLERRISRGLSWGSRCR
jgi:hypothetical protein